MGTALGAALVAAGNRVSWAEDGRSATTRQRAVEAGFETLPLLTDLCREAELIFSVCPPEAAPRLAHDLAGTDFTGLFVDANAVSPETARFIANTARMSGCRPIDGGIVGPPPEKLGDTRLYLSGDGAQEVARIFAGTKFQAEVVNGDIGAASAVKMCYAAWTKGSAALLLSIRALARAEGVEETLLAEWEASQPQLPGRLERALAMMPSKAWRFVGEMEEISKSFGAAGLPEGFHQAAGEVNQRLLRFKDEPAPDLNAVLRALLKEFD